MDIDKEGGFPEVPRLVWDEEAAKALKPTRCAADGVLGLRDRSVGAGHLNQLFCKTLSCERCGPYLIRRWLVHATHCLRGLDRVYCVVLAGDARVRRDRLKQRKMKLQRALGEEVNYMVGERRGMTVIISTHQLLGDEEPSVLWNLDVSVALKLLAASALAFPGVTQLPSTSRPWSMHGCVLCSERKGPTYVSLGLFGDAGTFDDCWQEFATEVERRTGVRPLLGSPPPENITLQEWTTLMDRYVRRPGPSDDDYRNT